jgi:predicted oxidoreductase
MPNLEGTGAMGFYWILMWVVVLLDSPIRRRFAIKMSVEFAVEDLGTMLAAVFDKVLMEINDLLFSWVRYLCL